MSRISRVMPPVWLALLVTTIMAVDAACGAEKKGNPMTYQDACAFLNQHTSVVELTDDAGARVAVAPQWQGRVMTSTCGGPTGPSFGFINYDYVKEGKIDLHFNNFGGEDRMWLCPEGGQYSLWFKPGAKQEMTNWFTPPAFNVGPWKVVSPAGKRDEVRMAVTMKFENTAATQFNLDVTRGVRLLGSDDFGKLFGEAAAATAAGPGVKMVAYESDNQLTNRGADFSKAKGMTSIWVLGMMNAGPEAVIMAPYKQGPEAELGPTVKGDYFGVVPPDRLKVTPQAVLFRADGKHRSKIGISQRRVCNAVGSIDFGAKVLTLVQFTMPDDPTKHDYLNNGWDLPQARPYVGDVMNAYNDGPNDLGKQMGQFYEIESLSPAPALKTGESLSHCHRTFHIHADLDTLHKLAKEVLGVDLDEVRKTMWAE